MQSGDMIGAINAFLLVFAGLFPIVNALGSAPIFLSLTSDCTAQERDRLARGVAFNGFAAARLDVIWLGNFGILRHHRASCACRGRLLVTAMGWKLLNEGSNPPEREAVHREGQSQHLHDSFYPLTLPLTVGPGSISVAITFGSHRSAGASTLHLVSLAGAAVAGIVAICVTIYVCYRFAAPLARYLGQVGVNVLVRLSAFILVCIGIQIAWSGISALAATLAR